VHEENLTIQFRTESIPVSIWSPEDGAIRAVVLLGHGLGVDRHHEFNTRTAALLTAAGSAVVAPELPLHGERRSVDVADWNDVVSSWQEYWSSGGVQTLLEEWLGFQNYAADRFPGKPVGYFGLSLATQYGIPLLANSDLVGGAVLGLFGSHPPPKTPVMNHYAPSVSCPVAFVKQAGDELHPESTADYLFDSLGSAEKKMIAGEGRHAEVPLENIQAATRFLMKHLDV
jgi:hypothetical protein